MTTTPFETLIVPVRGPPKFGRTENPTEPLPSPAAVDVTETNGDAETAVHEQPPAMVMENVPLPPVVGNACVAGPAVKSQAVVDVVRVNDQLPAILPTLFPASSTAYRRQMPFGALP